MKAFQVQPQIEWRSAKDEVLCVCYTNISKIQPDAIDPTTANPR